MQRKVAGNGQNFHPKDRNLMLMPAPDPIHPDLRQTAAYGRLSYFRDSSNCLSATLYQRVGLLV